MSTQTRNSGSRNQKKSNSGGGGGDSNPQASVKKTDASKTEKEKIPPKPTAEQLRIAQITNTNAAEDPHMREKVAKLIETTNRSEDDVCCALNECDNDLNRAVVFLLETLPVGAFETSSKKKKNKAANAVQDNAGGDGDWGDSNANSDRREKSRNRSSNRGGRGGNDSRGWRGREARENERNLQDSRGDRGERGGDRSNDNYRSGSRGGRGGRGGGYVGRGGRSGGGGGRMGGGRGFGGGDRRSDRGERGGYSSRQNHHDDDHQEVELWDNTIAQNAEKQQLQSASDDAWGDWNNEEYEGSLKDSKVFTTSNLQNQTAASIVSGGASIVGSSANELAAPPGLEHHLGTSVAAASPSQQGGHLNSLGGGGSSVDESITLPTTTSMMQYSSAVSNSQMQPQPTPTSVGAAGALSTSTVTQYGSPTADTFSSAATAAANLVQQVHQQVQHPPPPSQHKSSATLSAEQSQYFNSLTSQNAAAAAAAAASVSAHQQQQHAASAGVGVNTYAAQTAGVQYATSYANVFGTGSSTSVPNVAADQLQMNSSQQPQVRRLRAKLPPPSKIPATAVEMPGDTVNNIGYLDVQFGALDFGTDDAFDAMPEKFNAGVTVDQQQQQQLVQSQQDVTNEYAKKANVQQQHVQQATAAASHVLTAGLQNSQIGDSLSAGFVPRGASTVQQQQPQVVSNVGGGGNASSVGSSALDQLSKNDPYNQSSATSTTGYQSSYQTNASSNKATSAYQQSPAGQGYQSANYANVQSSVANSYQAQTYGSYQQNSVNSYQQQQQANSGVSIQNASNSVTGGSAGNSGGVGSSSSSSTQNIPVGGSSSNNNSTANSNTGYLPSSYPSQQSAYQSQNVYGNTGLSNNTGFSGSTSTSSSQYSNFSTSAKLKDTSTNSSTSHFDSVTSSSAVSSTGTASSSVSSVANSQATAANTNNHAVANVANLSSVSSSSSNSNAATGSAAAAAASNKSSSSGGGAGGMVPNIQMVSQYIQTGLPYYQQPVYSYEEIQMMQQRVPHVQGYYDLNYTPTSLGAGRDNLGSVAYSTMTDGRFARTDNNSSPVSNVSSTMSQQAGSGGPMLNVPYAYFYGGNMMPGSFQYGTPAIYPQQIPTANTASGGQFPKPSYNTGYSSTSYDTLSQTSQDYTKGAYPSGVNQQTKSQNVTNPPQAGTGSDITSSMYGKGHVALNKVNSYEKQNFHSGTPPPFNMPNTQAAGGTSAQPYGMYLPMPAAGHHNMIHQPIHQMDGRIHNSSRRDSNSTGQRQQTSSQSKSGTKQGYSPSYWTGQN